MAEFGLLDAQLSNLSELVAELNGHREDGGVDDLIIDEDELEVWIYTYTCFFWGRGG